MRIRRMRGLRGERKKGEAWARLAGERAGYGTFHSLSILIWYSGPWPGPTVTEPLTGPWAPSTVSVWSVPTETEPAEDPLPMPKPIPLTLPLWSTIGPALTPLLTGNES